MVREDNDTLVFSTQLSWGAEPTTPAPQPETFEDVSPAADPPVKIRILEDEDDEDEVEDPDGWDDQLERVRVILVDRGMDKQTATDWLIDLNSELDGSEDDEDLAEVVGLVDASRTLQNWPHYEVNKWRAAMSYLAHFGSGTDDTDLRYNLVAVADNWDDWATNHADELIAEEGPSSTLERYYEFDYEQYAIDLRDDYTIVEMYDGGSEVLIFS